MSEKGQSITKRIFPDLEITVKKYLKINGQKLFEKLSIKIQTSKNNGF